MRRTASAFIAAALLAVLAAGIAPLGPAFGVMRHQCAGSPCTGTKSANYLDERHGNGTPDAIYGRGGRDRLAASPWTRDRDVVKGGRGRDALNATQMMAWAWSLPDTTCDPGRARRKTSASSAA